MLQILLWPLSREMSKWGSYEQALHSTLIVICIAPIALVTLVPVFWRGKPWHAPIAFVLLWLPGYVLYQVVLSTIHQA